MDPFSAGLVDPGVSAIGAVEANRTVGLVIPLAVGRLR